MAAIIKDIKVSVCMATYNHQKYIKQAIEGILMQKTDFEFELLISNDFSTDSTSQIINEIIINNPNGFRIVFYEQEYNLGMHLNGDFLLKKAQGKYIAICEGDDFWTNPNKLQIQFDYLEQNINQSIFCLKPTPVSPNHPKTALLKLSNLFFVKISEF